MSRTIGKTRCLFAFKAVSVAVYMFGFIAAHTGFSLVHGLVFSALLLAQAILFDYAYLRFFKNAKAAGFLPYLPVVNIVYVAAAEMRTAYAKARKNGRLSKSQVAFTVIGTFCTCALLFFLITRMLDVNWLTVIAVLAPAVGLEYYIRSMGEEMRTICNRLMLLLHLCYAIAILFFLQEQSYTVIYYTMVLITIGKIIPIRDDSEMVDVF